jgi:hypothetical protein
MVWMNRLTDETADVDRLIGYGDASDSYIEINTAFNSHLVTNDDTVWIINYSYNLSVMHQTHIR